jgi:hypothetical protein
MIPILMIPLFTMIPHAEGVAQFALETFDLIAHVCDLRRELVDLPQRGLLCRHICHTPARAGQVARARARAEPQPRVSCVGTAAGAAARHHKD